MATLPIAIDARGARIGAAQWESANKRIQGSATRTGSAIRNMFAGLTAGIIIRKAVQTISGFEETMATVGAVTRAVGDDFQRLEDTARTLGATTRFSAKEAGDGLLFLARAGFDVNESINALPSTLDLASAGVLDLGEAADVASNILKQFGIDASDTVRVVDTLIIVSNRSNTNVRQMAEAFKIAGPVAGALGKSVEATAAAIGVLGDRGIQASLAGTNLRGTFAALLSVTGRARTAMRKLGVDMKLIDPAANDLVDIFDEFKRVNLDAASAVQIFGRRNAAAALIFADSTDDMRKLILANKENRGEAERVAKVMNDTLAGAFRNVRSAVEELFLSTGDAGLRGGLKALLGIVADTIRVMVGMEDKVKDNIVVATFFAEVLKNVGILLGVVVAIKAVFFFGSLATATFLAAKAMIALSAPLLAVFAVLATGIAAGFFIDAFIRESKIVQTTAAKLISSLKSGWIVLKSSFNLAVTGMKILWLDFVAFARKEAAPVVDLFEDIKFGIDKALGNVAKGRGSGIISGANQAITGVQLSPREEAQRGFNDAVEEGVNLLEEQEKILKRQLANIESQTNKLGREGGDIMGSVKDSIKGVGVEINALVSDITNVLFPNMEGIGDAITQAMNKATTATNKAAAAVKETNKETGKGKEIADALGNAFAQNLEDIVFGAASAKDAMKAFVEETIKEVFRLIVTQQIARAISGGISGGGGSTIPGLTNARGNVFNKGSVIPFAFGGVIGSPTTFPMRGGRTGLMGESGPEAIMPLQRGRDGRLGVSGGGGSRTINMTVVTPDADSFRKSDKQIRRDLQRGLRG